MTAISAIQAEASAGELCWLADNGRAPRLRSMLGFAESEIVLPDGPFAGRHFQADRQPYVRLLYDAIDSGAWNRIVITGPTQSGKSLCGFVIPILFHLFEIGENVIVGLPDLEMASDKWHETIKPVVERTKYRELLPSKGGGSRGGTPLAIRLGNGATLRFMGGGGGDKQRAHFTSRVIVITETDGLDESGSGSREADKITQLEARGRAYGDRIRVYMECTVSIEEGRTWQEYSHGTHTRILLPCPHCEKLVCPERADLVGWSDAMTQGDAMTGAAFACPACKVLWTESDRRTANLSSQLAHRGQDGWAPVPVGDEAFDISTPQRSDTLGFRWTGVNNLFTTAAELGRREWNARLLVDEENAEKELRQFDWCLPHVPDVLELAPLDPARVQRRTAKLARGQLPEDTEFVTIGIDIGKWLAHWVLIAWRPGARSTIVDYSRIEVPSAALAVERAIEMALRDFADVVAVGWPQLGRSAPRTADAILVDAGYQGDVVLAVVRALNKHPYKGPWWPVRGYGTAANRRHTYRPRDLSKTVRLVGDEYHVVRRPRERISEVHANADHWKGWLHERLTAPPEADGAMTLYAATPNEHLSFAKHVTAERQVVEWVAGKGEIRRWEMVRRNNHWLDASYYACVAGHLVGVRLVESGKPAPGAAGGEAVSLSKYMKGAR